MPTSKSVLSTLLGMLLASLFAVGSKAQEATRLQKPSTKEESLQAFLNSVVADVLTQFTSKKLQSNQLAVTVVDLSDTNRPAQAAYRGEVQIYPASVVKLFYLAATHRWLEDGRLADTPELRRAMRDMIVESYNEATHYIIDLLTDTTSGPELSDHAIDIWFEKRNAVNRYFDSLGYTNINANKKPWCEGPYGRESQSIKRHTPNRNMLTTDATARLLTEIATGKAVTPKRSSEMLHLMKRDPFKRIEEGSEPDQGNAFTGLALRNRPEAKLWSKAGWTSQTRHDAAYVELPQGIRFVLIIFTLEHANDREIIEAIANQVADGIWVSGTSSK